MKDLEFPLLTAEDIEVRIGNYNKDKTKANLLLYKTARTDAKYLDKILGPYNWQREHEVIDGKLFCTVSIWDEDKKMWVKKQDVGVESNTEAEKGQASDSFKRSSFMVGIGRELYSAPNIWVDASHEYCEVVAIGYNSNREIDKLVIRDSRTKEVIFTLGSTANNADPKVVMTGAISKFIGANPDKRKSFFDWVKENIGKTKFSEMSEDELKQVCEHWKIMEVE